MFFGKNDIQKKVYLKYTQFKDIQKNKRREEEYAKVQS